MQPKMVPKAKQKKSLLEFCTWQALPWWFVFVISIYLTYKIGLTFDSPCAVLGVPSPTTRSLVNKAYRRVSENVFAALHPSGLMDGPGNVCSSSPYALTQTSLSA
jgi:hypothetical protein